ncbi:MAG: hypothetical protein ACI4EA_12080 [Candidatus Ornithomonoglobus sp.]
MKKRILAGLTAASMLLSALPAFAEDINEVYDEIMLYIDCESELSGLTLNDGAPDGSQYYSYGAEAAEFTGLEKLAQDTYADHMWEADVRFDAEGAGFTVKSQTAKDKVETCIRRNDSDGVPKLAIQTSGSAYAKYDEIDTDTWYHIQLIGQYGTTEPVLMKIYKWDNEELIFLNEYDNVSKRNNSPASYIAVQPNTSIDNVRVTKLGADTLTVSTLPVGTTELNAGSGVTMQFAASRNGRSINKPEIEWKIFENDNEITDGSVTINSEGELNTSVDCADKNITVKAISIEKGNVEGSYDLTIKSVNLDSEKFDTLSLSAENGYIREGEPLSLTVSASKNGENVELSDGDIVWKFYNEDNVQETGNKYIYVEDSTLYVTDKVISQKIVVRAESASGVISASLPVTVKASDAREDGEKGAKDILLTSDACEKVIEAVTVESGSWDGSHYYYCASGTYDMANVESTTENLYIEADIKFTEEGSGFKLRNSGNSKEGGQIARQGDKIGRVGASNKFVSFCSGDSESWYHIEIMTCCGGASPYGNAYIYKYDESGELVNPDDGTPGKPAEGALDLRTMASQAFHHIQLQTGTGADNMRILQIVPDELRLTLSADTVFAGGKVQGSCAVLRQGVEIPSYDQSKLTWAVYDAENKYPADTDLIAVDGSGLVTVDATADEQTVYIRVTEGDSGLYEGMPLAIKGSDIFTVTGIGVNEENTAITELKVEKNFFYSGDVVFIAAMYDENGTLIKTAVRNMRDNTLAMGENKISINEIELPESFGSVKVMVWTSL